MAIVWRIWLEGHCNVRSLQATIMILTRQIVPCVLCKANTMHRSSLIMSVASVVCHNCLSTANFVVAPRYEVTIMDILAANLPLILSNLWCLSNALVFLMPLVYFVAYERCKKMQVSILLI